MSYFCDLFSIFSLIFIMISHMILLKQAPLFLEYLILIFDDSMDEEN